MHKHAAGHVEAVENIQRSFCFFQIPEAIPTDFRNAAAREEYYNRKNVSFAGQPEGTRVSSGGSVLAGFLLSGFLLALLGAILPAWGYHRDPPDFVAVGNYFLSLAIGIVVAARIAWPIMRRRGLSFLLVF